MMMMKKGRQSRCRSTYDESQSYVSEDCEDTLYVEEGGHDTDSGVCPHREDPDDEWILGQIKYAGCQRTMIHDQEDGAGAGADDNDSGYSPHGGSDFPWERGGDGDGSDDSSGGDDNDRGYTGEMAPGW